MRVLLYNHARERLLAFDPTASTRRPQCGEETGAKDGPARTKNWFAWHEAWVSLIVFFVFVLL